MSVTACVCNDVSFRELLALAPRLDPDRRMSENELIDALSARTKCATGCGTCRPYIRLALRTGNPRQPVMSPALARELDQLDD